MKERKFAVLGTAASLDRCKVIITLYSSSRYIHTCPNALYPPPSSSGWACFSTGSA